VNGIASVSEHERRRLERVALGAVRRDAAKKYPPLRLLPVRAIESLPPIQRTVITLRDVQGWSAEEVRNALELSETNQRVILHRARSKVRRVLEEYLAEDA